MRSSSSPGDCGRWVTDRSGSVTAQFDGKDCHDGPHQTEFGDPDPDPRDLVRQLRVALGWADVALPYSPKQAWEECIAEVQRLVRMDQL
jgi:hypothetical protein